MKGLKLVFVCLLTLLLVACGKTMEEKWQEKYDLGMRYLTERSYEEAILAFTAAIEIDEMRVDGYFGLSDAYIGAGDFENAKATLEKGYELTQDEIFQEKLDSLFENHLAMFLSDDPVDVDDFLIGGKPVTEWTLAEFMTAYPGENEIWDGISEGDYGVLYDYYVKVDNWNFPAVSVGAKGYNERLNHVQCNFVDSMLVPYQRYIDFKSIKLCDSISDVLTKMGFQEDGKQYIFECVMAQKDVKINVSGGLKYTVYGAQGGVFGAKDGGKSLYLAIRGQNEGISLRFAKDELVEINYGYYE